MAFGLTSTGYVGKSQQLIRDELTTSIKAKRGTSTDCTDGSLIGQWIAIHSERESLLWDLGQAIVSSQDPDAATDASQDALCALTGTFRIPATSSQVTETLTGTPTTPVPQFSQVKTASTGAFFQTTSAATITALSAWAITTAYILGQRVTNASRAYQCITPGTSAGAGGPTTTSSNITDNTVHWMYLGDGTGAVDVIATSVLKDAITAASGDLTVIQTPVGGWQSARNVLDAAIGAPVQTNESLRVTREAELAAAGTSPADAIRAKLLKVSGVTACTVFQNLTDVVDVNGQPPHSVQALVQGGTDVAIAVVLLANIAAGIASFGTSSAAAIDSQGISHTMSFTRPTSVPVYVDITLTYNPASGTGYPSTGDTLVQAAVTTFGNSLGAGRDVVASALSASAFPIFVNGALVLGVQGVLDVSLVKIGLAPAPGSSATLVMTPFQLAAFDTSRVTVHSSAGSL